MASSGDKDFDDLVRRIEREFIAELKKGEKPNPKQVKEFWARVERARIRLVEKKSREATNQLVEETFKFRGLPMKDLGNHQYFVKPTSHQVLEFSILEEINRKLTDGKKIRAIKAHQNGMIIIIA